jgi:CxxC-x17-CxxC domain-containing protein
MNAYTNQENTYNTQTCSKCSQEIKVPFETIESQKIYCNACFKETRGEN